MDRLPSNEKTVYLVYDYHNLKFLADDNEWTDEAVIAKRFYSEESVHNWVDEHGGTEKYMPLIATAKIEFDPENYI